MRKRPERHCETCYCHHGYEQENPWVKRPKLLAFALGHRGTVWDEEEFVMFIFVMCEQSGSADYCYTPGKFGIHLYNTEEWLYRIYGDLLEEPEPAPLTIKQCRDALGRLDNKGFIKLTMKSTRSIIMEAEIIVSIDEA